MNILFVMYGDFATNSAIPMALYARELAGRGHDCAAAVPANLESVVEIPDARFRPALYRDALENPEALFRDGRPADIVHAWTSREGVRRFVTAYLARRPTPWIAYLEDNEDWIARESLAMVGIPQEVLLEHTEEVISAWTPEGMSHPLRHESFVGLADGAVVVQDRLRSEVPPWVRCTTVLPPVDLRSFAPRPADPSWRQRHGVGQGERVIAYPGGVNDFTRPGLEALCRAVAIINSEGIACRLLRSGPSPTPFVVPEEARPYVSDLGTLPREDIPALLALSDVLVQPGRPGPFDDLRLPGKLPEMLAMGRPVVLPEANIADLLEDGVNAVFHRTGTPEQMARKCLELFADPVRARAIGTAGRAFAEAHFEPRVQAARLEEAYREAMQGFHAGLAGELWDDAESTPVAGLLSRKLRLLAKAGHAGVDPKAMLEAHARAIDFTSARSRGLEMGMAHRDREIAVREEKIGQLEPQLEARNAEVASLGATVQQQAGALGELGARLAASEREAETLEATVAQLERHIAALESSLTWRLTRPIRIAGEMVSRWRRPAGKASLTLAPMGKDPTRVEDASGGPYWHAASCDPSFVASLPAGNPALRRGWYAVSTKLTPRSGRIAGPRLYIPAPLGGYSELFSVELKLVGRAYEAEFFLSHPAAELRFDPSIYPCDFECDAIQMTPVGGWRRWLDIVRSLDRLKAKQLRTWVREGFRVLATRGPKALWDAAFWALTTHARTGDSGYPEWVREYSTPSARDLAAMREHAGGFARRPLVSFITPVYNTPEPYLRAMIESVLAQAYPRWELCLADDASTAPHVRAVIEEYRSRDERIKVAWRAANGHISAASNTALGLATGDYVALLDHDDAIPPDALYWVVRELNEHPEAALLYSDEDKLDFDGERTLAYFKCDWNYDLFLAHNLITHLGVYRADIVRGISGFREGFEGAQDYDLALRFIERISPEQIRHIPRILYHWRMLRGSTSVGAGEKDYAAERARLAVEEHLRRKGIAASVETVPGMAVQRVRYRLPEPAPLASILIPTRNGETLVRQCIRSIREKTTYAPYEIVLVDNGSDDKSAIAYFHALRDAGVIRLLPDPRPFNFSRLNNEAARQARGDYLVFLNNDIEVISPDWLTELVSHARRPEIGAVGAKLWYPNDTIQHAGLVLVAGLAAHAHHGKPRGDHGYFSRASLVQALSAVTAACLCVRRAVFEEIGGFDETLAVAFNDVDLCLRIQAAGYRNLYTPYAELYHHESASRGYEDTPEKMQRFQKEADILRERWMPVLLDDRYYNPNLTLSGEPFTLAWPPRVEPFAQT